MNRQRQTSSDTFSWALALRRVLALAYVAAGMAFSGAAFSQQNTDLPDPSNNSPMGGPIRLRQPAQQTNQIEQDRGRQLQGSQDLEQRRPSEEETQHAPYKPTQFEIYVQTLVDAMQSQAGSSVNPTEALQDRSRTRELQQIRHLGAGLATGQQQAGSFGAPDFNPVVPPDYVLQTGDEVLLTMWGSVDADLHLLIDRSGRISVPRIGPIMVAGVRYADLPAVISQRAALVFKNFQLSVSLGQLRGVRVYVVGFVAHPGVVVASSLSTLTQALLRAGGPSAAGSFRNVQLRRGGKTIADFDFYDLLVKGDRSSDLVVQPNDVIYVGPIGPQVALIGSVNRPAVFELKSGETVADVLRMAGGFAAVADPTHLTIERMAERNSGRVEQVDLPAGASQTLASGDVLRALNALELALPAQKQNKRVRVEGEVVHPGEYVLPPVSTIDDALRAAGGLTPAAYLYGTEFTRESVRATQQENYDRALRDLETDFARNTASQHTSNAEDAAAQTAKSAANAALIQRLRSLQPTGRVVLQLPPEGGHLPDLALESGDRLYVPPRPTSIGVFGSVFNTGSYLFAPDRNIDDYLRLAGGPKRGADKDSTFVVHANGSVASNLQNTGWFGSRDWLGSLTAEPGDTIFVPEDMDKTTFIQGAKDWTQILYQFGLGIAGLRSATR